MLSQNIPLTILGSILFLVWFRGRGGVGSTDTRLGVEAAFEKGKSIVFRSKTSFPSSKRE